MLIYKMTRLAGLLLLLGFLQGCGSHDAEADDECDGINDGTACGASKEGACCSGICDLTSLICYNCLGEIDGHVCSDSSGEGVCCDEVCVLQAQSCEGHACDGAIAVLQPVIDPTAIGSRMQANPVGNMFTASDGVATDTSEGNTDLSCIGSTVVPESALDFAGLSCDSADVHCPTGSIVSAAGDGDHLVVTMVVEAPVPLADPTWFFQYGFVFDSDGAPGNNWAPVPNFPLDFFGGADLWIELAYNPTDGMSVAVSDISAGNTITPRASTAAKVVLIGNVLLAVIPVSEAGPAAGITYRGSVFKHQGSFLSGPWNGDAFPAPPAPLAPVN